MNRKAYRPEIDGLRAAAILPVLLFHLDVGIPGGYTGVDIFFVISGFLITRIIEKELTEKRFSIINFWERRVRRIFPPLVLMVFATLAVGYYLLIPQELLALGEAAIAQTIFSANIFYWQESDYFTGPAELKPLLHTWSLAVEEQFYFVLPLILLVTRKWAAETKFRLLSVFAAISLATSIYGTHAAPTASFYLLPMRAWEMLAGSILALLPWNTQCSPRWGSLFSMTGAALITAPFFLLDKATLFPGLAAIPSVAGTALLLYSTENTNSFIRSALTFKPMIFLGKISYSLYLWHWPVIVYVRIYRGGIGLNEALFCLITSVSLAILSYNFVEQPFRSHQAIKSRRTLFLSAVAACLITIMIGAAFAISGGYPKRFPNYSSALTADLEWKGNEYSTPLSTELILSELPTLGLPPQPSTQHNQLDLLVWGDSHARTFCYLIDDIAKDLQLSGKAIVTAGVLGMPGVYQPYNDRASPKKTIKRQESVMALLEHSPPKNLIIANRWSAYTDGPSEHDYASKNPNAFQIMDNQAEHGEEASGAAVLTRGLKKLAAVCERKKIKLWIIEQAPETDESQPAREILLWSIGLRTQPSNLRTSRKEHKARQQRAQKAFATVETFVTRLDPADQLLDENGMTLNYLDGRAIYRDDDHLTKWGLQQLRPAFYRVLKDIKLGQERN